MITLCKIPGRVEAKVMNSLTAQYPQATLIVRRGAHASAVRVVLDESSVPTPLIEAIARTARMLTGQ